MRRGLVAKLGALGLVTAVTVGSGAVLASAGDGDGAGRDGDGGGAGAAGAGPATTTAPVVRRDLVERQVLSGTLGYGARTRVATAGPGTVTALPAVGSVVERGAALVEVDGRPVPLLYGDRPLWRPLAAGVADGPDVRLLEENLAALGHAPGLRPDERFDARTEAAVKRWQKALGVEQTGVIQPGDAAVLSGPARVASHLVAVGGQAGGPVVEVTGTARLVEVDLEARRQRLVREGDAAEVELPDGTVVAARVAEVGTVATAPDGGGGGGGGGEPTLAVTLTLDDPGRAGELDAAPVTVRVTKSVAAGVLAVPVRSLLALAEGGYAVERVRDGRRQLVGVETGAFADGHVAVTGDLREGDTVVMPA